MREMRGNRCDMIMDGMHDPRTLMLSGLFAERCYSLRGEVVTIPGRGIHHPMGRYTHSSRGCDTVI